MAGIATTGGVSLSDVAGADGEGPNDGVRRVSCSSVPASAVVPFALANPVVQSLTASDFIGLDNSMYSYESPGGIRVTAGAPTFFDADLRLPVGATIVGATVFLNPSGISRVVRLTRYRPLPAPTYEDLVEAFSSTGAAVEAVPVSVDPHRRGWLELPAGTGLPAGGGRNPLRRRGSGTRSRPTRWCSPPRRTGCSCRSPA